MRPPRDLSKEHLAWRSMKMRCYLPRRRDYHLYGGRGITVCARWRDSYAAFLADMGRAPSPGHSIDRIDNNGNYEPGNCRWATAKEQGRNRITNHMVEVNGKMMPLIDACAVTGINYGAAKMRIKRYGWSPEKALSTPVRPYGKARNILTALDLQP